jgi:hypothetical protein
MLPTFTDFGFCLVYAIISALGKSPLGCGFEKPVLQILGANDETPRQQLSRLGVSLSNFHTILMAQMLLFPLQLKHARMSCSNLAL